MVSFELGKEIKKDVFLCPTLVTRRPPLLFLSRWFLFYSTGKNPLRCTLEGLPFCSFISLRLRVHVNNFSVCIYKDLEAWYDPALVCPCLYLLSYVVACALFVVSRFLLYCLVYSPQIFLIQISGPRVYQSHVKLPRWWRDWNSLP